MKTSFTKRVLQAILMMAITAALLIGISLPVSAGLVLFPDNQGVAVFDAQNGVSATATQSGGAYSVANTSNYFTFRFDGTALEPGTFKLTLDGGFIEPTQTKFFRAQAGETFSDSTAQNVVFTVHAPGANMIISDVIPTFEFFPDLRHEFKDDDDNSLGITATGAVNVISDTMYTVNVLLTGEARSSGSYFVYVSHKDGDDNVKNINLKSQMFTFGRNDRAGAFDLVNFNIELISGDISDLVLSGRFVPNDLYTINYADETILFDDEMLFALVKDTAKFTNEVKYQKNLSKVKWQPTLSGRIDISRFIPKKASAKEVSLIVRRVSTPNADPVFITLKARPDIKALVTAKDKTFRKKIYNIAEQTFINTTDQDLELRFDLDRSGRNPHVEVLGKQGEADSLYFHHDRKPFGVRGTYRIAAVNFEKFVVENGELRILDGAELELAASKASFSSLPVKFRTPAQPKAPDASRMVLTQGKNGAPWFISRTTPKMKVALRCDDRGLTWGNFPSKNLTIAGLIKLFEDDAYVLPIDSDGNYTFEVRTFKAGKPDSRPAYLVFNADEFHERTKVSAVANPFVVTGVQNSTDTKAALARGVNMVVVTSGGVATVKKDDNVSSWFANLPDGLEATIKSVSGARITITIKGFAKEASDEGMVITIPGTALTGGVDVEVVVNSDDNGVPLTRFNIAEDTTTSPGAIVIP